MLGEALGCFNTTTLIVKWAVYDNARLAMCNGTIDMDSSAFQISLHDVSSNAATRSLSILSQVTNELPLVNGYARQQLTTYWQPTLADPDAVWFSADDPAWFATDGNLENIGFAVIATNTGLLLCELTLDAPLTITSGHALHISCGGILRLV